MLRSWPPRRARDRIGSDQVFTLTESIMTESPTTPPAPAGAAGQVQLGQALAVIRLTVPILEHIVSFEVDKELIGNPYGGRQFDLRSVLVPAREAFEASRAVLAQTPTTR